jgi:hypothetical protein
MKTSLIFFLLAIGTTIPVNASCPDIKGTYKCVTNGKTTSLMIDQRNDAGVTVYKSNGFEFRADNQPVKVPSSNNVTLLMVAYCTDVGVMLDFDGTIRDQAGGIVIGKTLYENAITRMGNHLMSKTTGTAEDVYGHLSPITGQTDCDLAN